MKNVAIIGSSGGNLFNHGGQDAEKLLQELLVQCEAAHLQVNHVQFIGADASMDRAKQTTGATLYTIVEGDIRPIETGQLQQINEAVAQWDAKLADHIHSGEVDGLIVMSADPKNANRAALRAATERQIPIVGTGGTAMADIQASGANVIASSGTTGTTNRTRAISFVAALAKHGGIKFRPQLSKDFNNKNQKNPLKNINIKGIMMTSLPSFIAMALILALSKVPLFSGLAAVFDVLIAALPVVIAVVAAKQVSDLDEVSIVAGAIAGTLSIEGGIIGGMIGGILAGISVNVLFMQMIRWRFPMTTVNIFARGLAGLASGLVVFFVLGPIALQAGELVRSGIEDAIAFNPMLAGTLAGLLIWPAILGGVYHAAILPIVLFEMERTGASFLGAVDLVSLVMVAAGINLAHVFFPKQRGQAALAAPGVTINLGFGTFVESAYPFMFSSKIIFAGAIVLAGLGGMMVGLFDVRGTAYLPTFMAPFASTDAVGLVVSMTVAFVCAFLVTVVANRVLGRAAR